MVKKKYDIAVKTGTYMKDGQEKGRYQNVGAVIEGDNGPYILLAKWFNPAGVVDAKGGESIPLSLFEPRQQNQQPPAPQQNQQQGWGQQGGAPVPADSDDCPF